MSLDELLKIYKERLENAIINLKYLLSKDNNINDTY